MHIRKGNTDSALQIIEHAVKDKNSLLGNNVRAWHFYIDLLHSNSDLEGAQHAYDKMVMSRIATPITILNYTAMLQQQNKFEESFRIFEKAVKLFPWPNCYEIWLTYLTTMIQVFGGSKLERLRYLFKTCLKDCPSDKSELFFLLYADYEENFGLYSHALSVLEQACLSLNTLQIWNTYIGKVAQHKGIIDCRKAYE
jgi:pre-mRNA-splicing factor SYF1